MKVVRDLTTTQSTCTSAFSAFSAVGGRFPRDLLDKRTVETYVRCVRSVLTHLSQKCC